MKQKIIKAFLLFALLINITSCIITTPYDRQAWHRPHPTSLMHRPRPVKSASPYSFVWNPFGYSSSQHVEHWQRYHAPRQRRIGYYNRNYVVHPHYHKVKYRG